MDRSKIDFNILNQKFTVIVSLRSPLSYDEVNQAVAFGFKGDSKIIVRKLDFNQIIELSKKDWCDSIQLETFVNPPSDPE